MTLPDKLLLDPIDKYEHFGKFNTCIKIIIYSLIDRFPWKLIVHIILIVITTALVVLLIQESATY